MTNQENKNSDQLQQVADGQFLISGDLDFRTVPEVLKASQSMFANNKTLTIDLSGVESSNSAGLALLLEWMRVADSGAHSMTFLNLPDQMKEIAQLCGVDEKLPV
jgi:phospholipid transport system transporter-binding protein